VMDWWDDAVQRNALAAAVIVADEERPVEQYGVPWI
jgi:hypothetical protein